MKMLFIMNVSVLLLLICPSVISEVIDFSYCSRFFYQEQPPVIPGILENSRSMGNPYKTICQKYENEYRFATFYNTTNRIPVFSAYRFIGKKIIKRPGNIWRIEPELEPSPNDEMRVLYENQAIDEDFFNNTYNMSRGHLYPSCHSCDNITANSTFTMTNAVPQKINFNNGSWNRLEKTAIDVMDEYCRDKQHNGQVLAHVLTGAVPGNTTLNNRVNIPSHMWMTFCCYNISSSSWSSKAYWGANIEENINDNVTISERSLEELQEFLSNVWVKITKLFHNNCE
ncbi:endonuclease domain-containing 1 protein-like [Paramisgurnus dabryanus]|uniref:endonuclease domain-containing 1 protein-like n=1 Tax=Paramisgurnus dabryanus TaxID=90735 RepID=UPI0031F42B18